MKIKECIDIVDNLKPNQYSIEDKVDWLSYIDHSIINEVLLTHEGYDGRYDDFVGYSPDVLDAVLIVPSPYDRLYPAYIKMKIDEENGETARYNNSVTLFNAYLMEYKKWYNSNHMPLSQSERRTLSQKTPSSMDVTDAQLEQLRKLLYAEFHDDMLKKVSDDKLYAIVKTFMDTNAQMLKGKDGRDGVDGKDGNNGKDGLNGANGVGIQKAWIENGELKITLTSGVTQNLGVVKGEKGDRGDRGVEGAKGDKGDRGEQGDKGEKGEKGDRGYTGQRGTSTLVAGRFENCNVTINGFNARYRVAINELTSVNRTYPIFGDLVIVDKTRFSITMLDGTYAYLSEPIYVGGANGTNGKSAYQYAQDGGFIGTEAEFATLLASLGDGSEVYY